MSEPLDRNRTDLGTVVSIRGSVVDARFPQRLPPINHQLSAGPEGSIVINRELTLWDFRFYIMGALAFIMAQSSLIAGLLILFSPLFLKKKRVSAELRTGEE